MWFRDYKYHAVAPFLVQDMKKLNNEIEYFLYARKSSESDDRQVQSIDDQIDRLKEYASRVGIKIKKVFIEAKSAKLPGNRPVFAEMMEGIKAGKAQGILCWQINRLSRNPVDGGMISWMLQQGIIKSIQTTEREYKPEDNTLLLSVETGMANQFIIDLKKNVRRGMDGKAQRGEYPTKPPLGYKNDRLNKTIVSDEERLPMIKKMWDMLLSGNYRPPMIVKIVNEEWGFRTPRTPKGGDKEISKSTIYKLFNNIFYAGVFEWHGEILQGNHRAIITLDEYDKAQRILGKKGKPRFSKHEHAYTGEIQCEECGCLHTASLKSKVLSNGESKSYGYYYCTRRKKNLNCSQTGKLTTQELENQIDAELKKCQIHPRFLQWALDYLQERKEVDFENKSTIREQQEATYNKIQGELSNLSKMLYKELISEEEFLSMRDDLRSQSAKVKSALDNTENESAKWLELTQEFFQFSAYARDRFNDPEATAQEKKAIFRALGWNFSIKDKVLRISKHKWIETVENEYPSLEKRITALELDKNLAVTERTKQISMIRLDWCAYRDSNSN